MKCPYCLDTLVSGASVCKSCGRDIYLIGTLQLRVTELELELANTKNNELVTQGDTPARLALFPPLSPHGLEIAALIGVAALLPVALYDLISVLSISTVAYFAIVISCSGAIGFLIGNRGIERKLTVFILGIFLAVIQAIFFSISYGHAFHAYYRDTPVAHTVIWWATGALRDYHLWVSQVAPTALLFVLLALMGRSMAKKRSVPSHRSLGSSLATWFTTRNPEEGMAAFHARLEGYTKIFDDLTHVVIVILAIIGSYYTVSEQAKRFSVDPSTKSLSMVEPK